MVPGFETVNLDLLLKFCTKDSVIDYVGFCDMLRRFEVHDRVDGVELDSELLELVGGELPKILFVGQHVLQELMRLDPPEMLECRQLVKMF